MNFDFSLLYLHEGDYPDKTFPEEIVSVYINQNLRIYNLEKYSKKEFHHIACGYSKKKRILIIAARLYKDKTQILQVKVASEQEINRYYCHNAYLK